MLYRLARGSGEFRNDKDPTKAEATWYEHLGKLGTVPYAVMGIALEQTQSLTVRRAGDTLLIHERGRLNSYNLGLWLR
jgi:hypothetical protein